VPDGIRNLSVNKLDILVFDNVTARDHNEYHRTLLDIPNFFMADEAPWTPTKYSTYRASIEPLKFSFFSVWWITLKSGLSCGS